MSAPLLAGVVVHWHNEPELAGLLRAWPADPRFELVVVDNGSGELPPPPPHVRLLRPERNLGFAGGVNAGLAATTAEAVLILNPDAHPRPAALDALLDGLRRHPEAAGLAPRLVGTDGAPQFRWQLRRLPTLRDLLLQAFFVGGSTAARREPGAGSVVEQPAACALLLRRRDLVAIGGMDEGFQPAWFEDVDLAARLRARGARVLYWPDAVVEHGLGASVPRLGYGRFLWAYGRGLDRYAGLHHGATARRLLLRPAVALGATLRLLLLPLRKPRRAASRRDAARGLAALVVGACSGFARPRRLAAELAPSRAG